MLGSLRKFSSTIYAKILLGIVVIPFIFWGMGSSFVGGNKNIVLSIDKEKYSTQDFVDFIRKFFSPNQEITADQIEEILTIYIGEKLIEKEADYFKIKLSDNSLSKLVKNQKDFKRDNEPFLCLPLTPSECIKNTQCQFLDNKCQSPYTTRIYHADNEYTYLFSIYVNDFQYKYGEKKYIIRRINSDGVINPEIYISAETDESTPFLVEEKAEGCLALEAIKLSSFLEEKKMSAVLDRNEIF